MNVTIVLAVIPVIFIGELPDKTMFASLVLATRGRPAAVWVGAAGAFIVHVAIATTIGVALFTLLPRRVVDGVVAGVFLAGALLAYRQSRRHHDEVATVSAVPTSGGRVVLTAFVAIFLAEWGDLTQILTANLAAHYRAPFSVGLGALVALWAVAAIAVAGGHGMVRYASVVTVRRITAVVLVVLGGYSIWLSVR